MAGTEVARGILRCIDPEIPILTHPLNADAARRMAMTLIAGGFEVAPILMAELTQDRLLARLETVRDVQRRLAPGAGVNRGPRPKPLGRCRRGNRATSVIPTPSPRSRAVRIPPAPAVDYGSLSRFVAASSRLTRCSPATTRARRS